MLFDIDGTIITSRGAGLAAVSEALELVCGVQIVTDGISFAGRTDPAIMRDLLSAAGLSESRIEDVVDDCLNTYISVMMRKLTPSAITVLPGVQSLIRRLHTRGDVVLGLLTGNLQDTAYLKLHAAGLGSYFTFGAFGSDEDNRNQLPEVAASRAKSMSGYTFYGSSTVIIGDTPSDIVCAKDFGAYSIGVCTGFFERCELEPFGADLLLDDLSDPDSVVDFIDRIGSAAS